MGLNGVTGLNGGATGMSWNGGGSAEWTCTISGNGDGFSGTGVCESGTKISIAGETNPNRGGRGYRATVLTVSNSATAIIKCWGAGGGGQSNGNNGGGGGFCQGTYTFQAGQSYRLYVGGGGGGGARHNDGNENSNNEYFDALHQGGGRGYSHSGAGGGYTGVFVNANASHSDVLILAGGGGGGTNDTASGGNGGIPSGTHSSNCCGRGGQGGTQSAGGNRGCDGGCGTSGGALQGGNGGGSNGAGGGGGYYGGGGGGGQGPGGGGGGSGYVGHPDLSNTSYTNGSVGNVVNSSDSDFVAHSGEGGGVGNSSGQRGGAGLLVIKWQ